MTKSQKKAVKRVLDSWRDILSGFNMNVSSNAEYAEAFFVGAWTTMSDDQVAYLLERLSTPEYKVIMKYPIWM